MKITSDVYSRNKLVSHRKESVKWPYKPAFYAFMCLCITENESLLLLKLKNNVVFIDLVLSLQCHLVLPIISVFFTKT